MLRALVDAWIPTIEQAEVNIAWIDNSRVHAQVFLTFLFLLAQYVQLAKFGKKFLEYIEFQSEA